MSDAELLSVVEVPFDARIRCQAEGCGHSVYKRIHVVRDGDTLKVLGSDCFNKLFGRGTRSQPRYGGSDGRVLTQEERELLLSNTAQLLQRFQNEHEASLEEKRRAEQTRPVQPLLRPTTICAPQRIVAPAKSTIWSWMKPLASMGYFRLKDGTGWVRVLRTDGKHILVPWPSFDGWDEALPAHIGQVDLECGGYVIRDVVETVSYLRERGIWDKVCGSMRELEAEATRSSGR